MDNARFVLVVFFFFLSVMLYQQWQIDYGPKPVIPQSVASAPKNPDVPGAQASGTDTATTAASANDGVALESKQRILVETDAVRLELDTEGGDIRVLELKNYPENKDHPEQPVRLFTDQDLIFIAQNGLIGDDWAAPNPVSYTHLTLPTKRIV